MIPRKVKEIERDLCKLHQCYAQYIGIPRESNGQIKVWLVVSKALDGGMKVQWAPHLQ